MKKRVAVIEKPLVFGGIKVVLVSEVSLKCESNDGGIFFTGVKQPIGVVVNYPSQRIVFRVTGEIISLDQLIGEDPDLRVALESLRDL